MLCRAEHAHRYTNKPIYLRATTVRTRRLGAFEVHSPWLPIEQTEGPTVDASRAAFELAGIGPEDVDVIQLQDTDAGAEVIHLAENGFCVDGDQESLVAEGTLEIGGPLPVNTDGGLIANGEPIGASGLRQVHEVVLQLRGQADERQVPGEPKVGYTQLYGAPGHRGRVDPLALARSRGESSRAPHRRARRDQCVVSDRGRAPGGDARHSASIAFSFLNN